MQLDKENFEMNFGKLIEAVKMAYSYFIEKTTSLILMNAKYFALARSKRDSRQKAKDPCLKLYTRFDADYLTSPEFQALPQHVQNHLIWFKSYEGLRTFVKIKSAEYTKQKLNPEQFFIGYIFTAIRKITILNKLHELKYIHVLVEKNQQLRCVDEYGDPDSSEYGAHIEDFMSKKFDLITKGINIPSFYLNFSTDIRHKVALGLISSGSTNDMSSDHSKNTVLGNFKIHIIELVSLYTKDYDHSKTDKRTKVVVDALEKKQGTDFHSNSLNPEVRRFIGVLGAIVVIIYLFIIFGQEPKPKMTISHSDANYLCKKYIGTLLGRPASIMSAELLKKESKAYFIKISYYKDGKKWETVCHIANNTILWAALFEGNDLGRWRYEDEKKIRKNGRTYNLDSN